MLFWLSDFSDGGGVFNLFRYISFRAFGAFFTSLGFWLLFGRYLIGFLRSKQGNGQPIREDGPESHILTKAGTPTMGGVIILLSLLISVLLWGRLDNVYIWVLLWVAVFFAVLGLCDDYQKVHYNNTYKGVSARLRLLIGIIIGAGVAIAAWFVHPQALTGQLALPIFKDSLLNLGWFFIPFAAFVVVGSANAVNLTDGLDGLAIMPVMIAAGALGIIAYIVGRVDFATYLDVHYIPGSSEIFIFTLAVIGSGLGFLWYNAPPAMVFMGDTGALSLGGVLGAIAVLIKHEIVLVIIGGLFVVETCSVILQVLYFKNTGKRIFLMAPIHHHFEKKGWAEPQIVIRFWIIALVLAMIGIATLKLR